MIAIRSSYSRFIRYMIADDLNPVVETLQQARSIGIFCHIRPDGDALGSLLGLGLSLRAMNKAVRFFSADGLPLAYRFLPEGNLVECPPASPPDCERIVVVDTSTQERVGSVFQTWNRQVDINLDHHVSNTRFGLINIIRPDLAASALLVQEIIENAGWPMSPAIAANLYVGVSTDTGSFRHSSVTAEVFRAAARLVDAGANPTELARQCYRSVALRRFELARLAMQTMKLECDNQLAYVQITPEMFQASGALPEDSEGLIEKLQELAPVCVAAVFESAENSLRVSLRSKGNVDVNALAARFGGGGHPAAAGIRVSGPPEINREKILESLRAAFTASPL
ncbi:MAG: DHH family phosphoesterase [bacterium]